VVLSQVLSNWTLCWEGPGSAERVEAGQLSFIGPELAETMTHYCTLGIDCTIRFFGNDPTGWVAVSTEPCPPRLASEFRFRERQVSKKGTRELNWVRGMDSVTSGYRMEEKVEFNFREMVRGVDAQTPTIYVCWGKDAMIYEDLGLLVGSIALNGPELVDMYCWMQERCETILNGTGLSGSDMVLLLSNGTCGVEGESAAVAGLVNPKPLNGTGYREVDFGVPMNGIATVLTICYQRYPSLNVFGEYAAPAFRVDIGTLIISGPEFVDQMCTYGEPCSVTLYGFGLSCGDTLSMRKSCASESPAEVEEFGGLRLLKTSLHPTFNPRTGECIAYHFGLLGRASVNYALCWQGEESWRKTVGVVRLRTPGYSVGARRLAALPRFNCTVGIPCIVDAGIPETVRAVITSSAQPALNYCDLPQGKQEHLAFDQAPRLRAGGVLFGRPMIAGVAALCDDTVQVGELELVGPRRGKWVCGIRRCVVNVTRLIANDGEQLFPDSKVTMALPGCEPFRDGRLMNTTNRTSYLLPALSEAPPNASYELCWSSGLRKAQMVPLGPVLSSQYFIDLYCTLGKPCDDLVLTCVYLASARRRRSRLL
jgi:hypothetical protein